MSDTHAQTVAFARDTMLPPAPPPSREAGPVRWLRENLLGGPLSIVLTVLSVLFLWYALRDVLPWALRGIWDADTLAECRARALELYGEGVEAACWAVISDRWLQLLFGFYPSSGYWRPPAALLLFLLGVSPVLFPETARRLLPLTALMPFLCFWLLWGGPVWGPLSAALGFALGWVAFRAAARANSAILSVLAAVAVPLLWWFALGPPVVRLLSEALPIGLPAVSSDRFGGFTLSVVIGLSAICLSLPLGVLLALARRSDMFIVSKLAIGYIEIIRGVPLIVWLFTAQLLLNYFLPRGTSFDLMLRVIIMVTLFASAYLAEVIRGGLAALPKGQGEGADSLGLDYWQSMRLIILPQALRISIPGIVNTFIGLFKDTTLVAFIGMLDPMGLVRGIRSSTDWNGVYWEIYVFIALVFFVFCFAMSRYSIWLEGRLARDRHR